MFLDEDSFVLLIIVIIEMEESAFLFCIIHTVLKIMMPGGPTANGKGTIVLSSRALNRSETLSLPLPF